MCSLVVYLETGQVKSMQFIVSIIPPNLVEARVIGDVTELLEAAVKAKTAGGRVIVEGFKNLKTEQILDTRLG